MLYTEYYENQLLRPPDSKDHLIVEVRRLYKVVYDPNPIWKYVCWCSLQSIYILDDFNKHGPGLTQPSVSTAMRQPVPTTPAPPMAITNQATAAGFIANSEDVLTRAAALGRGAATTGFKKFIALTEAAKDRKDGPLRRLFNAWFVYFLPSQLLTCAIIFLVIPFICVSFIV